VAHLSTVDLTLNFLVLPQLLAARDAGAEVIGISAPGQFVSALQAKGIRHLPLPASTRGMDVWSDIRAARQLWHVLRRERIDILHTHTPKPGFYGRLLGRSAGVPIIVNTVHGLFATPEDPLLKRLVVYGLEGVASRFSDAELVQSGEDMATMRRWRMAPARKLRLLGNGVDLDRFQPNRYSPAERAQLRDELGIGPSEAVVGMVARLVAEKGWRELFQASRRLSRPVRLLAVGPDEPHKSDAITIEELTRARADGVVFAGLRTDVERLYAVMDVFALPSYREGFPRSVMEASAMGLPVVTTRARGCREAVTDGVTGYVVPVRDVGALVHALQILIDEPGRRHAMGAAARSRAEAEFDERLIVKRVLDTYEQLTDQKNRALLRRHRLGPATSRMKRISDVVAASSALLALSPVMGLIWLAIRLKMGRPVLFVQPRPGYQQRVVAVHKFRTMTDDRDGQGQLLSDVGRVTPLGRWLRERSLDELPQLLDVIRGDMSLVGPRPLLIRYLDRYTPEQARRHDARPGITGWAQVNGRNGLTWEERFALDTWYIDHWSLRLDLQILLRTIGNVLQRSGISAEDRMTMPEFFGTRAGAPPGADS
jgi:lipopolysaccharide/colanic/teichoic acid biosynthesis glycosyltransferase/glycosyltransferase involved in cell wall biosynthesis